MKPVNCIVKDDPANGSYGDCVRACIASILEMEAEQVPHFYQDGDGETAFNRMRTWLSVYGRIPAYFPLAANLTFKQVCSAMSVYGNIMALLYCKSGNGDHCVIINENGLQHDPAWYKSSIDGPHSSGQWIVIILAKV